MSQEINIHPDKFEEILKRSYMSAASDAILLGQGFISIKRLSSGHELEIKHLPWIKVKDALEDMGVIGALGGRD